MVLERVSLIMSDLFCFCDLLPDQGVPTRRQCCALSTERVYHAGQYMLGSVQKSFRLLQLYEACLLSSFFDIFLLGPANS
jgi:hypothetical protein